MCVKFIYLYDFSQKRIVFSGNNFFSEKCLFITIPNKYKLQLIIVIVIYLISKSISIYLSMNINYN